MGAAMAGCGAGPEEAVGTALDTVFEELFPPDAPGAAVTVVKDGHIVYDKGFGLADLDRGTQVTDTTMFNICSISKQFSAMALFILAEEGALSLDDPVAKFFPEFPAEPFRRITLRHLLSHTSGIPDARPRTEAEWQAYRRVHPSRHATVREFDLYCEEDESCRYMETLDSLAFEPGTRYEYQNPTFQLMLMIVERVTGTDFDTWMRTRVFLPCGMGKTVYFQPDRPIPDLAHGYVRAEDGTWHECDYGEARFFGTKADGGLYTTPLEFVLWDRAVFGDRLISARMREEAHTGHVATDIPDTDYGYGWFVEHRPDRPRKIYHTGDNGGFYTFAGRFPDRDLFYLIFATHPHWDRDETVGRVDAIFAANGWI